MTKFTVMRIANGNITSLSVTTTLRIADDAWNTLLILHSLLKSAAKMSENPRDTSQGVTAHAMLHPRSSAFLSFTPKGKIALARIITPNMTISRKIGWLILTTRCFLLITTHPPKNKAIAIIMNPNE